MERYIVFYASGVDSSSLTASDTGADVDLACFRMSNITAIMGEEDLVYIYFIDSGRFEEAAHKGFPASIASGAAAEIMEQTFVRLTVAEGKEIDVIEDLASLFSDSIHKPGGKIVFDAVNNTWPISNVTAIQIRRHLTTHTIASD
tara:strand:+ start:69 stop:503 length:435 start_codon:yes stop_codon:yes gene_type:complete